MVRTRSPVHRFALSRFAARRAGQVAVSAAATLVVALIYAALPNLFIPALAPNMTHPGAPSVDDIPPSAGLTSGGKFAARVPGLEDVVEREGAMPSTSARSSSEAAVPVLVSATDMAATRASLAPSTFAPAQRVLRLPRRPSAKHDAAVDGAAVLADGAIKSRAAAPADAESSKLEAGVVPGGLAAARSAWDAAASAGASLVSRGVP